MKLNASTSVELTVAYCDKMYVDRFNIKLEQRDCTENLNG